MPESGRSLTPPVERVYSALASRFRKDQVVNSEATRQEHAHGESYHPDALPDAVFYAESTDDVASALTLCHAHDVPVVAFGAGTSLEGHVAATNGGLCIDLSRMNRVVRVSGEDLDCTVECGVTRRQLNHHLGRMGLFFPVDPGADASIGGMVATGASGTNAVGYGTMRNNVLGLTVVLADERALTTDVCVPISALSSCVTAAKERLAAVALEHTIVGHVGDGNFHVIILFDPHDSNEVQLAEEVNASIVMQALSAGGTCSGEHGIGYGKVRFLEIERAPAEMELMRSLKRALDPRGILNPGKILRP